MYNITQKIDQFVKEPFNPKMDLWGWLAFLAVIGGVAFLWFLTLNTFKKSL